jgi:glycine cleavage system H protein
MSKVREELKYTKTHEWVRRDEDGILTVGITDHAQDLLGDMVFIELPEAGVNYATGDDCAVVESVKAASDVYCPVAGEIIAVNEVLTESPEKVNEDPFDTAWLFKIKPEDPGEMDELLDSEAYAELAESEEH